MNSEKVNLKIHKEIVIRNANKIVNYNYDYPTQTLICENATMTGFNNKTREKCIIIKVELNVFKTKIQAHISIDKCIGTYVCMHKHIITYVYNLYKPNKDIMTTKVMKNQLIDLLGKDLIKDIIKKHYYKPFTKMLKADLIQFYQHELLKQYV